MASYRLGVLYTEEGKYDKAVGNLRNGTAEGLLNEAQQEIETLPDKEKRIFDCIYVDICLKKGKCLLEKRGEGKLIEECYLKALEVLSKLYKEGKLSRGAALYRFFSPLEYCRGQELVFGTPESLAIDLYLSWAICCLDLYDRMCVESDNQQEQKDKAHQLEQCRNFIKQMETEWPELNTSTTPTAYVELKRIIKEPPSSNGSSQVNSKFLKACKKYTTLAKDELFRAELGMSVKSPVDKSTKKLLKTCKKCIKTIHKTNYPKSKEERERMTGLLKKCNKSLEDLREKDQLFKTVKKSVSLLKEIDEQLKKIADERKEKRWDAKPESA